MLQFSLVVEHSFGVSSRGVDVRVVVSVCRAANLRGAWYVSCPPWARNMFQCCAACAKEHDVVMSACRRGLVW